MHRLVLAAGFGAYEIPSTIPEVSLAESSGRLHPEPLPERGPVTVCQRLNELHPPHAQPEFGVLSQALLASSAHHCGAMSGSMRV